MKWSARGGSHIARQAIGPSSYLTKYWNGHDPMRSVSMPPFLKRGCDPQRGIDQCQFSRGVASGATTSGSTASVIAVRFQKPALRRKPNAPNTQFAIKCMKVLTVYRKLPLRCCGNSSPTLSYLGLRLTNERGYMMSFAHAH